MKVLNLLSQRSLHLIYLLPFLCHEVAANTEIISFSSSREPTAHIPLEVVGNWSTLRPTDNERRCSIEPAALHTPLHKVCERIDDGLPPFSCPHELWLVLDLDDAKWASYAKFTLRLSWPASTPADFEIALYTSHDVLARLSEHARIAHLTSPLPSPSTTTGDITTRTRYARIRAVHAGVPVPNSRSHPRSAFSSSPSPRGHARPAAAAARSTDAEDAPAQAQDPSAVEAGEEGVPLVVILEPAYWGVLPATLLPTVGVLVPVVLAAALVVHPWVMAYLEPFVRQATEDVKKTDARAK
ncbi:hypothetical protein V8E55_000132 [Tylopilus felleus]